MRRRATTELTPLLLSLLSLPCATVVATAPPQCPPPPSFPPPSAPPPVAPNAPYSVHCTIAFARPIPTRAAEADRQDALLNSIRVYLAHEIGLSDATAEHVLTVPFEQSPTQVPSVYVEMVAVGDARRAQRSVDALRALSTDDTQRRRLSALLGASVHGLYGVGFAVRPAYFPPPPPFAQRTDGTLIFVLLVVACTVIALFLLCMLVLSRTAANAQRALRDEKHMLVRWSVSA